MLATAILVCCVEALLVLKPVKTLFKVFGGDFKVVELASAGVADSQFVSRLDGLASWCRLLLLLLLIIFRC